MPTRDLSLNVFTDAEHEDVIAELLATIGRLNGPLAEDMRQCLTSTGPGARLTIGATPGSRTPDLLESQMGCDEIAAYQGGPTISRAQFCLAATQANRGWVNAARLFGLLHSLSAVTITLADCDEHEPCLDRLPPTGPAHHPLFDVAGLLDLKPQDLVGRKCVRGEFTSDHAALLARIQQQVLRLQQAALAGST